MKPLKTIAIVLVCCMGLLFGSTACAVYVKKDQGNHRGWYKNSNNPHHHHSTNPAKFKMKHRK
jgi:hypothetical protein